MRTKAIQDLNQLSDDQLFHEVAQGLDLILENAIQIEKHSLYLSENGKTRGYKILQVIAAEEAAKYLILLDAIRCPRSQGKFFSRQLGHFDKHLAKGIYAHYYELRLATFGEVRQWIKSEQEEYYLDGPEGFEWIFRNEIIQKREESFYVDYIESDNEHIWLSPKRYDTIENTTSLGIITPPALKIAQALGEVGCNNSKALALIAEFWRPIAITDDLSLSQLRNYNSQTLEKLESHNLLCTLSKSIFSKRIDEWLFPLYNVDLGIITVDKSKLRQIQECRAFDLYY